MRIVHLPLDSRPCNVLFPGQLAAFAGHECVIPPAADMDDFTTPAPFERTADFLLRETGDALVVSVDHLCYGSLLGSRNDEVREEDALKRLELLKEFRQRYAKVYACSVVMRSSISALYAGDLTAYRAMTEYSVYCDRAARTGDPEDMRRAQEARALIPEKTLARYQLARRRNHAVNLRCVQLAAEGVIDALVLLQEDSELYGFHKAEQRALLAEKDRLGAANVWLHNGADEGGALAVMKAIADGKPLPPVDVVYLGWPDGDFVACYEDRPFYENVDDSLSFAGLKTESGALDVLAVCCPPDGRQTDWENPDCLDGYRRQAEEIVRLAQSGRHVYLLDETRANGGSPALMRAVHALAPDLPLCGYSAWNTASNALGTAIAQIISDQLAGHANRAFFWERMLDDLAYQGAVRADLNAALEAAGEDPLHLQDPQAAQAQLVSRMQAYTQSEPMFTAVPPFAASLPWNRTFEAQFLATKE